MSCLKSENDIKLENLNKAIIESQPSSLNFLNRFISHYKLERIFNILGHYIPVCSRLIGFYIAAVSYFILAYFFYIHYTAVLILFTILILIPAFLDVYTQLIGPRLSNNLLRFLLV